MNYNDKMKKHKKKPCEGHAACAAQEYHSDLKEIKHDDQDPQSVIKLGKRCCKQLINN